MDDHEFDEIRRQRILANEQLFRSANQSREADAIRYRTPPGSTIQFVCECGEVSCVERVAITLADYLRIHESQRRFVVVPGHEIPQFESVIERTDRYAVVEKHAL